MSSCVSLTAEETRARTGPVTCMYDAIPGGRAAALTRVLSASVSKENSICLDLASHSLPLTSAVLAMSSAECGAHTPVSWQIVVPFILSLAHPLGFNCNDYIFISTSSLSFLYQIYLDMMDSLL